MSIKLTVHSYTAERRGHRFSSLYYNLLCYHTPSFRSWLDGRVSQTTPSRASSHFWTMMRTSAAIGDRGAGSRKDPSLTSSSLIRQPRGARLRIRVIIVQLGYQDNLPKLQVLMGEKDLFFDPYGCFYFLNSKFYDYDKNCSITQ